jgi:hypothetical protein
MGLKPIPELTLSIEPIDELIQVTANLIDLGLLLRNFLIGRFLISRFLVSGCLISL